MRASISPLSIGYGGYARTSRGATAGRIARKRPRAPILAAATSVEVSRCLCVLWSVDGMDCEEIQTYELTVMHAEGGVRGR